MSSQPQYTRLLRNFCTTNVDSTINRGHKDDLRMKRRPTASSCRYESADEHVQLDHPRGRTWRFARAQTRARWVNQTVPAPHGLRECTRSRTTPSSLRAHLKARESARNIRGCSPPSNRQFGLLRDPKASLQNPWKRIYHQMKKGSLALCEPIVMVPANMQ